jgi:hypothetical protein
MADSAALLADEVLPAQPIRQWVLSLPFALQFWLATDPGALTRRPMQLDHLPAKFRRVSLRGLPHD